MRRVVLYKDPDTGDDLYLGHRIHKNELSLQFGRRMKNKQLADYWVDDKHYANSHRAARRLIERIEGK